MDYLREMESLKYVNNDIDFSFPFNSDEPTWQIINSLSSMYKESIDLINGELDIDELEKIVDLLDRSNRVFVYAIGDSRISAMGFTNKLIKIGKFFYIVTDNREEAAFSMGQLKMMLHCLLLILSIIFIKIVYEFYYIIIVQLLQLHHYLPVFYINIVIIIF